MAKKKTKNPAAVSAKVAKIMKEGVRKNTKAPVSGKNPRRKVPVKQAVAIAYSMKKRGKIK